MTYQLAPAPHYVTPEHAARLLRVNINSLYRALRANEVPHIKVGPEYRIPVQFLGVTPEPVMLRLDYGWVGQLELDLEW